MSSIRRAVIDVGTNSVKMLIADVADRRVQPLLEKSEQTRLGRGFYKTRRLSQEALSKTADAVARFAQEAASFGSLQIRVIATSAARDALNQSELVDAIRRTSGLNVNVISGEQEADWAYAGVITDPDLAAGPILILDVGGGSTEVILGDGAAPSFRESFPLGTVRLLESTPLSDPPRADEWEACRARLSAFLESQIRPRLASRLKQWPTPRVRLVGTGGTSTILARMKLQTDEFDRQRIEAVRLSREEVERLQHQLWTLPLARRRELPGLPPNRADVILMGVAIFAAVMETFGFADLRPSTRGLRFAAVLV